MASNGSSGQQDRVSVTPTIPVPPSRNYEGWPLSAPLDTACRGLHPIDWNRICSVPVGRKRVAPKDARDGVVPFFAENPPSAGDGEDV